MPGNIQAASASTVLPYFGGYTAYREKRDYPMLAMTYHDATCERALITDYVNAASSERQWDISVRLKGTQVATLYAFYVARLGDLSPFWFYPMDEIGPTNPESGGFYDPTGVSTIGRFVVRFANPTWNQTTDIALTNVSFGLYQVA